MNLYLRICSINNHANLRQFRLTEFIDIQLYLYSITSVALFWQVKYCFDHYLYLFRKVRGAKIEPLVLYCGIFAANGAITTRLCLIY